MNLYPKLAIYQDGIYNIFGVVDSKEGGTILSSDFPNGDGNKVLHKGHYLYDFSDSQLDDWKFISLTTITDMGI